MEKRIQLLTWLVVGSLLINVYSIYRLNDVDSKVQSVGSVYSIGSDISRLYTMIYQIVEENKWVVNQEFKPNAGASSPQEIHLDIEWTFKEIEEDANVFLLYRAESETEWTEVPAQNKGMGTFAAPTILSPKEKYEYQAIAKGSTLRTGEIDQIPGEFYRLMPLMPSFHDFYDSERTINGDMVKVTLQFRPPLYDFYKPIKAKAKVYRHDELLDEFEPRLIDRGTSFDIEFELEKSEANYIVFELEYIDGVVIEPIEPQYWMADVNKFGIVIFGDFESFEYREGSFFN